MGNNHDKYFGKDKRKVLVLGLPESGKTSLVEAIVEGKQANLKVQKTKDLNIRDANLQGLSVTFFDLAGAQRQRIFWKQHYDGTQGIIFLIDSTSSEDNLKLSLNELDKINKTDTLLSIPVAICIHKTDIVQQSQVKKIEKRIVQYSKRLRLKSKVFLTSCKASTKVRQMMTWLLKQTKPL